MKKLVQWKITTILIFLVLIGNGLVTIFAEKIALESVDQPSNKKTVSVNGVVDRIEDGEKVVILVEALEKELVIHQGDFDLILQPHIWLRLTLMDGEIKEVSIDLEKTKEEEGKVKALLDKIKGRGNN
ncbi:hypothetical protein [Ornithinibacillus californiensis]|uniref:hypothetical protein n=1 Tax=Ornithinibacillus californiensis TaxID=161536 RepID=UPI00064D8A41|nr:hypothetical protein [Ornithinibacillus californiensis]